MHACGRLTAPPRECYTLHRKLRLPPSLSTSLSLSLSQHLSLSLSLNISLSLSLNPVSPLPRSLSPSSTPPLWHVSPTHQNTHTHTYTHTILAVRQSRSRVRHPPPHTLSGAFLSCIKLKAKVSCKGIFDSSWALLHQRHLALTSA